MALVFQLNCTLMYFSSSSASQCTPCWDVSLPTVLNLRAPLRWQTALSSPPGLFEMRVMEPTGMTIIHYRASALTHTHTHLNGCWYETAPHYLLPFITPLCTCDEWVMWKMDNCQTVPFRKCSHEFRDLGDEFICSSQSTKMWSLPRRLATTTGTISWEMAPS